MKKETKKKVERTETYVTYHCDICKKQLEKYFDDKDKVEIEVVTEYSNYPEGGYKKGYAFDFCRECFERDVLPHIKVKPREIDIDW